MNKIDSFNKKEDTDYYLADWDLSQAFNRVYSNELDTMSKSMFIEVTRNDFEPKEFTPFDDEFYVFRDSVTKEVLGCANLIVEVEKDNTNIEIRFLEAYGDGKGRRIIEYFLLRNRKVKLEGYSLEDCTGFWEKMGAVFDENLDFEINKDNSNLDFRFLE